MVFIMEMICNASLFVFSSWCKYHDVMHGLYANDDATDVQLNENDVFFNLKCTQSIDNRENTIVELFSLWKTP